MSTKTYELGVNDKVLVISDLHLGDGTGSDDFSYSDFRIIKEAEKTLIEMIKRVNPTLLVLNGDIEELWQHGTLPIKRMYKAFYEFLATIKYVKVVGNHDYSIVGTDRVILRLSNDKTVMIEHGHQPEPFMTNPFVRLGVLIAGIFEKIFPGIDKLFLTIRDGNKDADKITTDYAIKNLDKFNYVVLGHTHKHIRLGNYFNSGSCQWGERQGVIITSMPSLYID